MNDTAQRLREHVAPRAARRAGDDESVERLLELQRPELERGLSGLGISVDRFARIVLTEVKRTPKLRECTAFSLLGAVMLSAQLGLEPGPMGLSYLVPRWSSKAGAMEVHFEIGYRGYIDLALRSGLVRDIAAKVVHEADLFDYDEGTEPYIHHKRSLGRDRGAIVCVYAVARTTSGGAPFVILDVDEVEERRARGAAGESGPWVTDWAAMARKTAVRALEPYLPRSVQLAQAVRADGAVVTDYTTANLADSDALDVPQAAELEEPEGGPEGEPGAPSEPEGRTPSPAEGTPVPSSADLPSGPAEPLDEALDDELLGKIGGALLAVEAYRNTVGRGATARKRELDEFLVTDLGLPVDLDGALTTAGQADAIVEWLDEHPIGGKA